jgi:hypothetical protein
VNSFLAYRRIKHFNKAVQKINMGECLYTLDVKGRTEPVIYKCKWGRREVKL